MSAINVNSITGRTGGHGPVLTGVTTVSDGNLIVIGTGASIGIGTSAPKRALEIMGTSGTSPIIRFSDTDSALSNGEVAGAIEFSQNDSFDPGSINASIKCVGDGSTGSLAFDVYAGTDRQILRIEGTHVGVNTTTISNSVDVAVGGTIRVQDSTDATQYLTINHQGIDFQNTGAGSSSTSSSHLLDDYEEGTWTPGYAGSSSAGSYTFTTQAGAYTKIGNRVTVDFKLLNIVTGSVGSGNVQIRGLPFTVQNTVDLNAQGSVRFSQYNVADSTIGISLQPSGNNSHCTIILTRDNTSNISLNVSDKQTDGADIYGSVTYFID